MSAIPQAITPNPHTSLLNVYVQIANKMAPAVDSQFMTHSVGRLVKLWL
jgi:hypothetical protein